MESTGTTQPTRSAELNSNGNNSQTIQGTNCSCGKIQDKCCLFYVSSGGYFGVVIFIIYICAGRSHFLAGVVFLVGILILPFSLKLCWVKVYKWQMEKITLQENAETFYRLSVLGRENEVNPPNTDDTLSVERNEQVVTITDSVRIQNSNEGALSSFNRTQLPPAYDQVCLGDLPPTYEEAVVSLNLQREEPNPQ